MAHRYLADRPNLGQSHSQLAQNTHFVDRCHVPTSCWILELRRAFLVSPSTISTTTTSANRARHRKKEKEEEKKEEGERKEKKEEKEEEEREKKEKEGGKKGEGEDKVEGEARKEAGLEEAGNHFLKPSQKLHLRFDHICLNVMSKSHGAFLPAVLGAPPNKTRGTFVMACPWT